MSALARGCWRGPKLRLELVMSVHLADESCTGCSNPTPQPRRDSWQEPLPESLLKVCVCFHMWQAIESGCACVSLDIKCCSASHSMLMMMVASLLKQDVRSDCAQSFDTVHTPRQYFSRANHTSTCYASDMYYSN